MTIIRKITCQINLDSEYLDRPSKPKKLFSEVILVDQELKRLHQ